MSKAFSIRVQQSGAEYSCADDDTVLRSGLRAGVGLSYECNVGSCGTCKFELIEGEVHNLWEEAPGLNPRDRQRGRMLGCQCVPLGDCLIKPMIIDESFVPTDPPRRFSGELIAVRDLTHDIREFTVKDSQAAGFRPGQYALLYLPGVAGPRAYSMSNIRNADGLWDFIIRKVPNGAGTGALFDLQVGEQVQVDGPYGLAYLRTEVRRTVVCIGGGSGLAPMLSIARGMVADPSMDGVKLKFFYGARGPRDLCGEAELQALAGFGDRIEFLPALSDAQEAAAGGWTGDVGFIHEQVKARIPTDQLQECEFYTCGPPVMINAVMQMLGGELKVPPDRIHYDSFV
ncbi:2Fe-2S iron-sulfur cluster-binding protein [Immundisolibacter sp.]|uniref:2Fe-2S iron-sulfur cluster-binding protein n=1 Tax=Immundisolibacter sp. TaxID=1934948 RepID=UPI003563A751